MKIQEILVSWFRGLLVCWLCVCLVGILLHWLFDFLVSKLHSSNFPKFQTFEESTQHLMFLLEDIDAMLPHVNFMFVDRY